MGKAISVWGAPGTGKTTFAMKLAHSIYEQYKATVLVLFCDNQTPSLPVLFPNRRADELYSVGQLLSQTEITQEMVIENIVTMEKKQNFGVMGFKGGENRYTYPYYDEAKCAAFLSVLKTLADYVVADCGAELVRLSAAAVKASDTVIRLAAPDLKSMSFFASQLPLYAESAFGTDRQIIGLNITENELFLPVEECKTHYKCVSFVLPYSRDVKAQMLNGTLSGPSADRKYTDMMGRIAEKVV